MKKIILFFVLINIVFAEEHLKFFAGQNYHNLKINDVSVDMKSYYSFGLEFSFDIGQNFEAGIGLEAISLTSIDGVSLESYDRVFPAYIRLDAKAIDNDYLVPYIFTSYGKLIADLQYEKNNEVVKVQDGKVLMLGVGVKIQKNIKIEIYDGTFTNSFVYIGNISSSTREASDKVIGVRVAYNLR